VWTPSSNSSPATGRGELVLRFFPPPCGEGLREGVNHCGHGCAPASRVGGSDVQITSPAVGTG
jgi:hypothetical protein